MKMHMRSCFVALLGLISASSAFGDDAPKGPVHVTASKPSITTNSVQTASVSRPIKTVSSLTNILSVAATNHPAMLVDEEAIGNVFLKKWQDIEAEKTCKLFDTVFARADFWTDEVDPGHILRDTFSDTLVESVHGRYTRGLDVLVENDYTIDNTGPYPQAYRIVFRVIWKF